MPMELAASNYENLIELTFDSVLKTKFTEVPISLFWKSLKKEYEYLKNKKKQALLPFASTYLCKSGFSPYTQTKSKYCARLNATPDIRIQLSNIKPNFSVLVHSRKHVHSAH